jgi:murein DD-endopeptidase MepM/ murein hydrolase activator NlpD
MILGLRLAWLAWQHRGALTRLLLLAVAVVVAGPLLLVGLVATALLSPVQTVQALGGAVPPMASWVVSQQFGCTGFYLEPPRGACPHFHAGIDLVAPTGTEVRAVLAGTIEVSPIGGYGNHVLVHHGEELVTLYGHLSGFAVLPGQAVAAGTVVGFEGSTGASTGAHLHFEVRKGSEPVDPVQVFPGVFSPGRPVAQWPRQPAGGPQKGEPT